MAASLLGNIGLPELVTTSLADYVAAATAIGRDPARHAALRAKLADGAWARSIGDSAGFVRRLEDAYRAIRLQP
jgi:predicted O-linked N-acetylglucosamine transferase (SPINDLY family)